MAQPPNPAAGGWRAKIVQNIDTPEHDLRK